MKATTVFVAIIASVFVQVALSRYAVGGRWVFDIVLVGVALAGLQGGAVAGMIAGTVGGLLQDVLSGGIVGVGGLAKTLVGCVVGVVGTQFVVARSSARMLIVAAATLVHRLLVVSLQALIDLQWGGFAWASVVVEMALNAVAALVVFQAALALPGLVARNRTTRRSSLSRRQW